MGSHGIGVSRLIGALIEANHDEMALSGPKESPFHCGIVNLKQGDDEADAACDSLYKSLIALALIRFMMIAKSGQGANLQPWI